MLSPELRDAVVRLFDEKGLLEAVLHVRRGTGAGLAEADAAVRAVLHEAGRLPVSPRGETSVELLAVGPLGPSVVELLDYDAERYTGVPDGTKVITRLFDVYGNDEESRELAACLGADVWDFNTHALDPWRADLDALSRLAGGDDVLVRRFSKLRAAGFRFFFRVLPP
ncbi:hypothetical protein HPC49_06825 [Pyxidicoccus fallax]|uniref:Uncharacterized protein n=1 Tax=Pyxidicoccus fallax TaxID=394095 RepID=A0A848LI74_9BACT|nr:hypothetical protein [Pyxidicoccus fallax]NMO17418.1 hypothetical protein [Pyxidicoccus fallax]NPC77967.1 hypothetical protein [Pyxidicoccus fallax]